MQSSNTQTQRIGARLVAARKQLDLTQAELAEKLGFETRQTLASIEAGDRRLSAEELIRVIQTLGVDLDFFTDAFRLVGEGRFSFRARPGVSANVLDQFEDRAGRWIATYRELGKELGESPELLELKLALTKKSMFVDAQVAAEALGKRWSLGMVPSASLQDAMERHIGALILYVDAPAGISGAASQLPGLNTVLVNRREPTGRRNFDLAHELFHLLTWHAMAPDRVEAVEVPSGGKGNRVEQLAENFAAALLMPGEQMRERWNERSEREDIHTWLNATAASLGVSATACKWRLRNLECLGKADLVDINDQRLTANGGTADAMSLPLAFSARFVLRIATALDAGRLSAKRAANLLALSLADLSELLQAYGVEPSFEA